MAEAATLARPYADAFFQVAAKGNLKDAGEQLNALAAVASDPTMLQFASDPKASDTEVFSAVMYALNRMNLAAPVTEHTRNLLRTVIANARLSVLPEIATQFQRLANASGGVTDATVYSAFPIQPEQLSDVVAALEKRFARKLNAKVQLEPGLIGGIRVVVGDEVLDTSVKARLEQMKAALTA
jgi:F-type H+-transporting ATPase subunit delta